MKKLFRSIIFALTFTMLFSMTVFAREAGNGESENEGAIDGNASISGFSKLRSGYMIYITDASGTPVSEIKMVPFASAPSNGVVNVLATRVTNTPCTITYNGTISTATNGKFNQAPLDVTTGATYGSAMKSWLITSDEFGNANVYTLIKNLFGDGYEIAFRDNDYYLCVEAVIWCGIQSSSTPVMIMGSVKTLNEMFNIAGSSYLANTRMCRLPHSGYLQYSWSGCTAPTIHSGQKESMSDLIAVGNGYGIIMCTSTEVGAPPATPPTPANVASDDYLKANELNYIFPDFIASTTAGRSSEHYSSINGGNNKVYMPDTNNWDYVDTPDLYRDCKLQGGIWNVAESITSDAVSFYGKENCLFYRAGAGQFKKPSEEKVFPEGCDDVYPGYGYMISRALWGDNLTVCEYKEDSIINQGNGAAYRSFITDKLKMKIGHDGGLTGVSAGTNVEGKVSTTKSATYTFNGVATEEYEENEKIHHDTEYNEDGTVKTAAYDEANWVKKTATIYQKVPVTQIVYSLIHGLYKYVPFDTGVVNNSYGGETLLKSTNAFNATTRVAFSSQFGSQLSVFPEVKYLMNYVSKAEEYEEPKELPIYCMGEEVRECLPASIHGYKVRYSIGTGMQGKSIVDAPLTGTNAFEFADNFNDTTQDYLQVGAQGSGFETASTNKALIVCTSFTLDLYDGSINGFNPKATWSSGTPSTSHDAFVSAIFNNIDAEVTMKRFTDATNASQFGQPDKMSFDYNKDISSTTTTQVRLRYKDGQVNEEDKKTVLKKIVEAYGVSESEASTIWFNSGIETQLERMFETSSDGNNNSGVAGITESKWYSEESDTLAITINQSVISVGDVIFTDKNDYGASTSQDEKNYDKLGKNGVECRFYFTLKYLESSISVDGYSFDLSDKMFLIREDEMKGARFLLSNITTNNWIR